MVDPDRKCKYYCEVLDGAAKPHFRVTCEDEPMKPIVRDTPSGVWLVVEKRINEKSAKNEK